MSDKLQVSDEWLSSLMDGRLRGDAFANAVEQLEVSDLARGTWDTYHLVGDIMRSGAVPVKGNDALFMERLRHEMLLSATKTIAVNAYAISANSQNSLNVRASNDAWWRRVAALASVAVVGVLAWQGEAVLNRVAAPQETAALTQRPAQAVEVAASPFASVSDAAVNVMLRDPQLDAFLAAHRQLGGATALQTPSGFLRNATFSEASR